MAKGMTPRKIQAMNTRKKIFEAAVTLFTRDGFENVTVDDICELAGVSKGSYYNHFTSKDQVVIEQFVNTEEFTREVNRLVADKSSCPEKLAEIYQFAAECMIALGYDITRSSYSNLIGPGKKADFVVGDGRTIYGLVEQLVREGQARGEVRTDLGSWEITRLVVSALRGVVYDWCLREGRTDLKAATAELAAVLFKGLIPHQG